MRSVHLLALTTLLLPLRLPATAWRADDYEEALGLAATNSLDIAVFQRGSDWNHLGERLYRDLWNSPAFAAKLGTNLILVSVDEPETPGNPPVSADVSPDALPNYVQVPSPASRLQGALTNGLPPPNAIVAITTSNGTIYTRNSNGTFVASGSNPHHEWIECVMESTGDGRLLRLDFPLDDSLPGKGPGRASNGNFAISEIRVLRADGTSMPVLAAWASASEAHWGPWQAIDGINDKPDNLWNAYGHQHKPRVLLLLLKEPPAASSRIRLQICCRASWGQHVPGTIRASLWGSDSTMRDVEAVAAAERANARNARFTWRGDDVPRIALMDCAGRPVTSEDHPRLGLTPAETAKRVLAMQAMREKRDQLWLQASNAVGPRRAELLLESLELLGLGGSEGHEKCYRFVQDQIRAADPDDASGCLRRMTFPPDPRSMPNLVEPASKLADEKKFDEAIALLDRELKDPRNTKLTTDHLQRLMMAKHGIYRQWPDHETARLQVIRDIAKLDPNTYLGMGAVGYLAMNHLNPEPCAMYYGWATNHVKPGSNVWRFTLGTTNYFDHPGPYAVRIIHNGGKGSLQIDRISLLSGDKIQAQQAPASALAPEGRIDVRLNLPADAEGHPLELRLESTAGATGYDVAGRFEVDPLL